MSLPGAHASCVLNAERSNRLVVNSTSFDAKRFYVAKRDVARRDACAPSEDNLYLLADLFFKDHKICTLNKNKTPHNFCSPASKINDLATIKRATHFYNDLLISSSHLTGTIRRILSSSSAVLPRPSRFEVAKYIKPSGPCAISRIRPNFPSKRFS